MGLLAFNELSGLGSTEKPIPVGHCDLSTGQWTQAGYAYAGQIVDGRVRQPVCPPNAGCARETRVTRSTCRAVPCTRTLPPDCPPGTRLIKSPNRDEECFVYECLEDMPSVAPVPKSDAQAEARLAALREQRLAAERELAMLKLRLRATPAAAEPVPPPPKPAVQVLTPPVGRGPSVSPWLIAGLIAAKIIFF